MKKQTKKTDGHINIGTAKEALDKMNEFSKDLKKINKEYVKKIKKFENDKEV